MSLSNPFRLLTWNSLFRSSRNRLRRHPEYAPIRLAAEVLEQRALLSGNVSVTTASIGGVGSITLTSDSGDNSVDVYRLDANHIEIDGNGTTINGSASLVLTLSNVTGITVNLGSGFDTYLIESKFGDPSLSVGAGGILFKSLSAAGGTGDDLRVINNAASAMTIGGNIIARGPTVGSSLVHTGSDDVTDFEVFTNSTGSLSVNGSISGNQSSTGTGVSQFNDVYTNGPGNLTVNGSVTFTESESGSSNVEYNQVFSQADGNLKITGSVTLSSAQSAAGSPVEAHNFVYTGGNGNVTIIGTVAMNTSGTGFHDNEVFTGGDGNLTVGLGIVLVDSNKPAFALTYQEVKTAGAGYLKVGLGVTFMHSGSGDDYGQVIVMGSGNISVGTGVLFTDSGNGDHYHQVATYEGDGDVTIGLGGVTVADSGSGFGHQLNIGAEGALIVQTPFSDAPILIKGSVSVVDTGTAFGFFQIINYETVNSPVTINGNVTYTHVNTTGSHDLVQLYGSTTVAKAVVTIKGSLTLNLSKVSSTIPDSQFQVRNFVVLGSFEEYAGAGYGLVINGVTTITGGNGEDLYEFDEARFNGAVIVNTMGNPGASGLNDYIKIDGSLFAGAVFVVMNGSGAEIDVNDGDGYQATEFKGLVSVTMTGSHPVIYVADGSGSGYSPVTFDLGLFVLGSSGAGATLTYNAANVSFLFLNHPFFAVVVT